MNNVQSSLMSVVPTPPIKANVADTVRPVNQAFGGSGAKLSSFVKTLAKVKSMVNSSSETREVTISGSVAASLVASEQVKPIQDAPQGNAEAAEGASKAVEAAPLQTVAAGEKMQAVQSADSTAESISFATEDTVGFVSSNSDTVASEVTASLDIAKASIPTMQEASQAGAVRIDKLEDLLKHSEKPQSTDLLQALSGKNLSHISQQIADDSIAADEFLKTPKAQVSAQTHMNQMANLAESAVLSDTLLRTLVSGVAAEQSVLFTHAQDVRQTDTASNIATEAVGSTTEMLDVRTDPLATISQDMAQDASEEGVADFLNQRQTTQEQETKEDDASVSLVKPLTEGSVKVNSTTPFFMEATQGLQSGQENAALQGNPAANFQTPLFEASSSQPTSSIAPQKDYEVMKQIVEQARLLRMPEQTEMVIRLKPEHLGELTLKVSVSASGAVNAAFHTDNAAVRAIIETSMIQFKQELQAQGLKVDNVGVYAGLSDGSLMNGQQDANAYYAQQNGQRSSRGHDTQQALASFEEEQQALAAVGGSRDVLGKDGVDYRV